MENRRNSKVDRRQHERRQNAADNRPDTEKGMIGERRSGKDRRGLKDRRRQGAYFHSGF
jgi:hypothetical protein